MISNCRLFINYECPLLGMGVSSPLFSEDCGPASFLESSSIHSSRDQQGERGRGRGREGGREGEREGNREGNIHIDNVYSALNDHLDFSPKKMNNSNQHQNQNQNQNQFNGSNNYMSNVQQKQKVPPSQNKSEISRDDYNNMQYGQHVPDRPYGLLGSTDAGIIAENERLKSVIREVTDVSHVTISIFNLISHEIQHGIFSFFSDVTNSIFTLVIIFSFPYLLLFLIFISSSTSPQETFC